MFFFLSFRKTTNKHPRPPGRMMMMFFFFFLFEPIFFFLPENKGDTPYHSAPQKIETPVAY